MPTIFSRSIFYTKLTFLGLTFLSLLMLLTACGDTNATNVPATKTANPATTTGSPNTSDTSQPSKNSAVKIGVILPGASNDGSWNSLGFQAVTQMRRQLNTTVDFVENITPDKQIEALTNFATKGYGLVIAHGAEFDDSIKKVAPQFPNVWFISNTGDIAGPNFTSVDLKFEEVTYLAGIAAAKSTQGKTSKFGVIVGPKLKSEIATAEGFRQGVQSVNPANQVSVMYLDSWDDSKSATAAANSLFDGGAEVILYDIDADDQPVLKVAQARGKQVINESYDLNAIAPSNILTSVVISVPAAFLLSANQWQEKKLRDQVIGIGLKEQAVSLAPFRNKLSQDDQTLIEQTRSDLVNGKLKISYSSNP